MSYLHVNAFQPYTLSQDVSAVKSIGDMMPRKGRTPLNATNFVNPKGKVIGRIQLSSSLGPACFTRRIGIAFCAASQYLLNFGKCLEQALGE